MTCVDDTQIVHSGCNTSPNYLSYSRRKCIITPCLLVQIKPIIINNNNNKKLKYQFNCLFLLYKEKILSVTPLLSQGLKWLSEFCVFVLTDRNNDPASRVLTGSHDKCSPAQQTSALWLHFLDPFVSEQHDENEWVSPFCFPTLHFPEESRTQTPKGRKLKHYWAAFYFYFLKDGNLKVCTHFLRYLELHSTF